MILRKGYKIGIIFWGAAIMKEVWVTGIGTVGSFGSGRKAFVEALLQNRLYADDYCGQLKIGHVARIPKNIQIPNIFEDDRKSNLGLYAAQQAFADANLDKCQIPPEDIAFFLGTGLSSITPHEIETDIYPHIKSNPLEKSFFCRASMAKDLSEHLPSPKRHLPQRLTLYLQKKYGSQNSRNGTSFSACAAASS